jgi:hypothetical protein
MKKPLIVVLSACVAAIVVTAIHSGIALGPDATRPYRPITRVIGQNHINCDPEDKTFDVTKVVVLHIPQDLLATLSPDPKTGSGKVACNTSCVFTADPDPKSSTDGDIVGTEAPAAGALGASTINWATPLDIDLNPMIPDPQHPGHQIPTDYWGKSGVGPVVLKIVLDNPNFKFFRPQAASGAPLDWSYAVMQGDEGNGMFRCVGVPQKYKVNQNLSSIAMRVFKSDSQYGGLNIGILVPADAAHPNVYVPLYIDPQLHNHG